MKNKKLLNLLFIIFIPIVIYFVLIKHHGADVFFLQLNSLDMGWISTGCLFMVIYWLLESYILNIMVKLFHSKQSFKGSFKTTMIGQFFNSITPFASGGQPMQVYYLVQSEGITPGCASSVLLLKFVIYQVVLTLYSLLILVVKFTYFMDMISHFVFLAVLGFLLNASIIIICFIFTRNKIIAHKIIAFCLKVLKVIKLVKDTDSLLVIFEKEIENFYAGILILKSNMKFWILASVLTFVQLTFFYFIPYFIYRGFGFTGNLFNIVSAQAFVQMVASFVPLPGASGAAEGSFYIFFQLFFSSEAIALGVLLWRIVTYYSCIVFGGVVMVFPIIGLLFKRIIKKMG